MERLKAGAAVWCPFDKAESAFVRVLSENGFRVTYGHIQTGQDFFHALLLEHIPREGAFMLF